MDEIKGSRRGKCVQGAVMKCSAKPNAHVCSIGQEGATTRRAPAGRKGGFLDELERGEADGDACKVCLVLNGTMIRVATGQKVEGEQSGRGDGLPTLGWCRQAVGREGADGKKRTDAAAQPSKNRGADGERRREERERLSKADGGWGVGGIMKEGEMGAKRRWRRRRRGEGRETTESR